MISTPFKSNIILFKKIILCLSLTMLGGCATTLDYSPELLKFDSPEVVGKTLGGSVKYIGGFTPNYVAKEYQPKSNEGEFVFTEYEESDEPFVNKDLTYGLAGRLGFGKTTEIYVRSVNNSPFTAGIKYQFFGGPMKRKLEGLKASVSIEKGYYNKIPQSDNFYPYAETTVGLKQDSFGGSLNVGYRFDSKLIVYLNTFFSVHSVSGELVNKWEDVRIITDRPERKEQNIRMSGKSVAIGSLVGIGIIQSKAIGVNINLELGLSHISWPETHIDGELSTPKLPNMVFSTGISMEKTW